MSSAASGISAMVHHGPFSLKDFDGALLTSAISLKPLYQYAIILFVGALASHLNRWSAKESIRDSVGVVADRPMVGQRILDPSI